MRIKAATEILNRTIGKPTEKVMIDLGTKSKFELAFEAMIVPHDDTVIDGGCFMGRRRRR